MGISRKEGDRGRGIEGDRETEKGRQRVRGGGTVRTLRE